MKVALVAIAKDEDAYIDEWIEYNLKLGFDDIFIFENEWIYSGSYKKNKQVHFNFVNDVEMFEQRVRIQTKTYNDFLCRHSDEFDFAAFIDIDEYIVLKNGKNSIGDFLEDYVDYEGVYLRWRLFGDSFIEQYNGEKGYVTRFTRCQDDLNTQMKSILNLHKNNMQRFEGSMHTPAQFKNMVSVSKCCFLKESHFSNEENDDMEKCLKIAYLNHYFSKTKEEYAMKLKRQKNWCAHYYSEKSFNEMMIMFDTYHSGKYNECEDFSALKFYNTGSFS